MDYERGLNNAFREVFGQAVILGCDFHFRQCLRKKLESEGLLGLYNSSPGFHQFTRY